MKLITDKQLCFIDFETTGIDPLNDEAIEIGALLVNQFLEPISTFESRIKPKTQKSSYDAFKIHGISNDDLIKSPSSSEVVNKFFSLLGNDFCFAAWNISFDVSFFRKICHESEMSERFFQIKYRHIDVQTICKLAVNIGAINSKVQSLTDCVNYFELSRLDKHNALEDAILCCEVYKNLLNSIAKLNFKNSE
jgi:DNA polymerase-3 subunit epsilon